MTYELRHLTATAAATVGMCWLGFHPLVAVAWAVGAVWLWRDHRQDRPGSPLDALKRTHRRITHHKETTP